MGQTQSKITTLRQYINNQLQLVEGLQKYSYNKKTIYITKIFPKKYYLHTTHIFSQKQTHNKLLTNYYKLKDKHLQTILNIQKFDNFTGRQFCSIEYTINCLFEYYPKTLWENIKYENSFTIGDFVKIYRFIVNFIEEMRKYNLELPVLGLSQIFINQENFTYKLNNPLIYQSEQQSGSLFYAPQNYGLKYSQKQFVFSLGMLLLSLCLHEDCSDCYNYKNFDFCWSVFQQKLERLEQINFPQIIENIYWMVQKQPNERPSIEQCICIYRKIIKAIHEDNSKILKDISQNTIRQNNKKNVKTQDTQILIYL